MLAALGWHVFPLVPRSKVPSTGHGLLDASCDREKVGAWWRAMPAANLGVSCGPSRLLVVDLDGEEAKATWDDLAARHGGHYTTLAAATGKGIHIYFAAPPGAAWARSTAGRIAPGIDTRGRGGYVVCPPSVHPAGATYGWVYRQPPLLPVPAPVWLVELLVPPPPSVVEGERQSLPRGEWATAYGKAALERIVDRMLAAPMGERNARLHTGARSCGRLAAAGQLDGEVARYELVSAAVSRGLREREAAATWASGFGFGVQHPVRVDPPASTHHVFKRDVRIRGRRR
jgi:hypothetical protein